MPAAAAGAPILGNVALPDSQHAEHYMGMPAVDRRRWTAQEVRDLVAESPLATPRYELVDGELLVTPSPRPLHQEGVAVLFIALRAYLARNAVGHALTSPCDVELEPEFLSQPDLYVMPSAEWTRVRVKERRPILQLVLAIEVLSPSSSRHDRVTKRPKYQRHVSEYWIVDLDARLIERWLPDDTRPEVITSSLTWTPDGAHEPFVLDVAAYFAEVLGT